MKYTYIQQDMWDKIEIEVSTTNKGHLYISIGVKGNSESGERIFLPPNEAIKLANDILAMMEAQTK